MNGDSPTYALDGWQAKGPASISDKSLKQGTSNHVKSVAFSLRLTPPITLFQSVLLWKFNTPVRNMLSKINKSINNCHFRLVIFHLCLRHLDLDIFAPFFLFFTVSVQWIQKWRKSALCEYAVFYSSEVLNSWFCHGEKWLCFNPTPMFDLVFFL